MEKFCYATITDISEQLRTRKASPVELVSECLDRIEKLIFDKNTLKFIAQEFMNYT